jgi:hypothetical protein
MKTNRNSFRIWLVTFEPVGVGNAFEVPIKFVRKNARPRKSSNAPRQPGRRDSRRFNGRAGSGDSAL